MMNSILYNDYDGDGKEDILLAGNFYPFRVQQGRCDAAYGSLLKGNGKGDFTTMPSVKTGIYIPGDTRDMLELKGQKANAIVISKNNNAVQVIRKNL
jgi:hypothetical protein